MKIFNIPIAHRGVHNDSIPENSIEAFKLAIEKGFCIETDVHLTKDEKVVCFHDFSLKRMFDNDKSKVSNLTLKELHSDKYRLSNGELIPTLEDLVNLVDGKVDLLIELKSTSAFSFPLERITYDLIKGKEDWISVQAFNPVSLIWFYKHAPEIYRGQLAAGKFNFGMKLLYKFGGPFKMYDKHKCHFLSYNIDHIEEVKNTNHHYEKLISWTIDSEEKIKKCKDFGVDNIIFEKLDINNNFYHNTDQ